MNAMQVLALLKVIDGAVEDIDDVGFPWVNEVLIHLGLAIDAINKHQELLTRSDLKVNVQADLKVKVPSKKAVRRSTVS